MQYRVLTAALAVAMTVSGCASHKPLPPPQATAEDPAIRSLKRMANEIHDDINVLRQLQAAGAPKVHVYERPTNGPLLKRITLRWQGDPVKVLKRIGQKIGYGVETIGKRPLQMPAVVVDAHNKAAIDIIEDIGWQAGRHILVAVDEARRKIRVKYVGR